MVLIFSIGFKGKPFRRQIRLHIFSLLHPLVLTKCLLISQRVAHSGNHFAQALKSMIATIVLTIECVCLKRQSAQHKHDGNQSWKTTSNLYCLVTPWYYGLHLSFVWLSDTHLYPNPLYSSSVYFSVNCITKPAVQKSLLKTKASKHHGTTFHKNIDFIGTAPILRHSCPIVFSMSFALRT